MIRKQNIKRGRKEKRRITTQNLEKNDRVKTPRGLSSKNSTHKVRHLVRTLLTTFIFQRNPKKCVPGCGGRTPFVYKAKTVWGPRNPFNCYPSIKEGEKQGSEQKIINDKEVREKKKNSFPHAPGGNKRMTTAHSQPMK